ncbi:MAG: NUDIX hydrolase [Patescibacteria group bacterium]
MKTNKEWHKENPLPKRPKEAQRIQWHVNHARECGCREIPPKIKIKMAERKPKVIVGVLAKNKDKYLLVNEVLEGGKSKWIVPGGKVEFGESLEEAAKRELQEETGLVVKDLEFVCFKEALFPNYNYHTVIFFYLAKTKQSTLGKDIEGKVQDAKWFRQHEIDKLPLVESAVWLFDLLWKDKN